METQKDTGERITRHRNNHVKVPAPRKLGRWLRYLFFGVLAVLVTNLALVAIVLTIFHFRQDSQGMVNDRVRSGVQDALGPNFQVTVGSSVLTLDLPGAIAIHSQGIAIANNQGRQLAIIDTLDLRIHPFTLFSQEKRFSLVSANGVTVKTSGEGKILPRSFASLLETTGKGLNGLQNAFNNEKLTELMVSNLQVVSPDGTQTLQSATIGASAVNERQSTLSLEGILVGKPFKAEGNYQRLDGGDATLTINSEGFATDGLFADINNVDSGFVAFESQWQVKAELPFSAQGRALQPHISLTSGQGLIRLGKADPVTFNRSLFNLRFFPNQEQFEIERSNLSFDGLDLSLTGHVWPKFFNEGYNGPIEFAMDVERATPAPTMEGEKPVILTMNTLGSFDNASKTLSVPKWTIATSVDGDAASDGHVEGQAKVVFGDQSPSILASFDGGNIPIAAIRQYWPAFIAIKVRDWARRNVSHGQLESASFSINAPPGLLDEIKAKEGFYNSDQFSIVASVEGTDIKTFGDLPPVTGASGQFKLAGASVQASINKAKMVQAGNVVNLSSGELIIKNFREKPATANLTSNYEARSQALFAVLANKPVDLGTHLGVKNPKFKGKANGTLDLNFPIKPELDATEVNWKTNLTLDNFSSNLKLFDKAVSDADVKLAASQYGVEIIGNANIDGTVANVDISQPFGNSGKIKKNTKASAVLDATARKKLGMDLSSFLTGTIIAEVDQVSETKTIEKLDFTKAELTIDAMGWKKGSGVPATATYERTASKGVQTIRNLVLSGQGFSIKGSLVLNNKADLISADLSHVALNKGDSGSLKAFTKNGITEVNFTAKSWDGRGVLSKLFHQGGFDEAQSGASMNLQANIGSVTGFNKRVLSSVNLQYKVRDGNMRSLDLKAAVGTPGGSRGTLMATATKNSPNTQFVIRSDSAGDTLAFINIYERMKGGKMDVTLNRKGKGPFVGPVVLKKFKIIDEPRLSKLVANKVVTGRDEITNKLKSIKTQRVNFIDSRTMIEKGDRYLKVKDGTLRANEFGIVYEGTLYDQRDQMNIRGTFLPAFAISMAVSAIPVVGQIFSNGKDNGLFGITYKLVGNAKNPTLLVNPMSIVAPGIFNKVFEFRQ